MESNKIKTTPRLEASNARIQHSVNKWGARVIPAILIGLAGYSVWVLVVLIAINDLLHPPQGVPRRRGAGIAIIVIYFVLLVLMAISYFRVLQVIATNPGFVPLPAREKQHGQGDSRRKQHSSRSTAESTEKGENNVPLQTPGYLDRSSVSGGRSGPPPGLEDFYTRDIFECEVDGLPRYCSTCKIWKPDRTHHSSETGRCVFKMDHFCPWAGGMVAETSFKFFVQFLVYGTVWNLFVMIVSAYFTAEAHRTSHSYNTNWIVVAALCGMLFLFAAGLANSSLHSTFKNSTTVDNLSHRTRIHHFAVLIPPQHPLPSARVVPRPTIFPPEEPYTTYPPSSGVLPPPSTTAPLPPPQIPISEIVNSAPPPRENPFPPRPYPTITYPLPTQTLGSSTPSTPPRTFAILATPTGSNPYRLPTTLANFKTVMGNRVWDWVLPIKYSPCCDHGHKTWFGDGAGDESGLGGRGEGYMYEFGPVVERMVREAGLSMPGE